MAINLHLVCVGAGYAPPIASVPALDAAYARGRSSGPLGVEQRAALLDEYGWQAMRAFAAGQDGRPPDVPPAPWLAGALLAARVAALLWLGPLPHVGRSRLLRSIAVDLALDAAEERAGRARARRLGLTARDVPRPSSDPVRLLAVLLLALTRRRPSTESHVATVVVGTVVRRRAFARARARS